MVVVERARHLERGGHVHGEEFVAEGEPLLQVLGAVDERVDQRQRTDSDDYAAAANKRH